MRFTEKPKISIIQTIGQITLCRSGMNVWVMCVLCVPYALVNKQWQIDWKRPIVNDWTIVYSDVGCVWHRMHRLCIHITSICLMWMSWAGIYLLNSESVIELSHVNLKNVILNKASLENRSITNFTSLTLIVECDACIDVYLLEYERERTKSNWLDTVHGQFRMNLSIITAIRYTYIIPHSQLVIMHFNNE